MTDTITALNAVVRVQNSIMRNALVDAAQKALELQTVLEVPLLSEDGNVSEEFSEFMASRFGHLTLAEESNV